MPAKIDSKVAVGLMVRAGLKPLAPYVGVASKWKCKCSKCNKIVYPSLQSIKRGQGGCKPCGYKKSSDKRKIDSDTAVAAMINAGFKPLEPYKGAGISWKCSCLICGEEISPTLNKVKKGSGCKFCKGIAKLNPEAAFKVMLLAGLKPLVPYKNSSSKWKSRCLNCKKIVSPTYSAIQQGQGSCVYCSGKKVDPEDAVMMMLAAKLQPLIPYKSHDTKWTCKCLNCGKIVFPRYDSIKTGQGGCIYCAEYGINMNTPSYLYLITNNRLNSHKIGIGNHKKVNDRLKKFNRKGWATFKVWNFQTGGEAWKVETSVFRVIRKELKLPIHLSKGEMPVTEGHTETIAADAIDLRALEKVINTVIKELSKMKR